MSKNKSHSSIAVDEGLELAYDINIDIDADGRICGVEIVGASCAFDSEALDLLKIISHLK